MLSLMASPAAAQGRRGNGAGITIFTNPNFGGQSATFRQDTPDLRGYGLNDKISSIEITGNESWEICQDINYGNRCQVVTGSVSDLRQMGWNDRISSLRRVANGYNNNRRGNNGVFSRNNNNNSNAELVFYDRPNFKGNTTLVTSQNSNVNRMGSVELRGRGAWQLCDRNGHCTTIDRSVSNLSQLGLNGRVVSVRPVYDNGYARDQRNRDYRYGR